MSESEFTKPALDKFIQWHFWWLVIFSLLLVVTFVWYLPTRFLQQFNTASDDHAGTVVDESQPHGHDASGNSVLSGQGDEHNMIMTDEEMFVEGGSASGGHAHMDEHMASGMSMEEMMEHMMEMHDMTEEEAQHIRDMMSAEGGSASGGDEMMGHEH